MTALLAYCGLDCAACEAYKATMAGDSAELERIAARWAEGFGNPNMTVADVTCAGCTDDDPRKCSWCSECSMRLCARERELATCAHCPDYVGCEKLESFFAVDAGGRARLDDLRRQLDSPEPMVPLGQLSAADIRVAAGNA